MDTATAAPVDRKALEATLSEYDFIACFDSSGSMGTVDVKGRSRWDAMQESAAAFCRDLERIDTDGIDVVVFGNESVKSFQGVTADKVTEVFGAFSPRGGTPMAEALKEALKLAGKSKKKDFIVVFTDGVPDDEAAVEKVIRDQANSQASDDELTILFIQVGHDQHATDYLTKLDDNLKGAKFDIVDAKTIDEANRFASTAELIAHAITD